MSTSPVGSRSPSPQQHPPSPVLNAEEQAFFDALIGPYQEEEDQALEKHACARRLSFTSFQQVPGFDYHDPWGGLTPQQAEEIASVVVPAPLADDTFFFEAIRDRDHAAALKYITLPGAFVKDPVQALLAIRNHGWDDVAEELYKKIDSPELFVSCAIAFGNEAVTKMFSLNPNLVDQKGWIVEILMGEGIHQALVNFILNYQCTSVQKPSSFSSNPTRSRFSDPSLVAPSAYAGNNTPRASAEPYQEMFGSNVRMEFPQSVPGGPPLGGLTAMFPLQDELTKVVEHAEEQLDELSFYENRVLIAHLQVEALGKVAQLEEMPSTHTILRCIQFGWVDVLMQLFGRFPLDDSLLSELLESSSGINQIPPEILNYLLQIKK